MSVFFTRRGKAAPATTIAVTIIGSGDATKCYAIINGTKQYSAGTHEVNVGDTITFGIYGNAEYSGYVEIDGTYVLTTKSGLETYNWTVPDGISTIEIAMAANTVFGVFGQINVTTA